MALFAASAPLLLGGCLALALWLTLPPSRALLHLAGLSAPVDVTLDRWGVPRIHAATEADAAAALGYLHARDRMFQMELMRRQASGRLAEIAGARAISVRKLSDSQSDTVSLHSRQSVGVQGSGAPSARNSGAASRPRSAIQAFTPAL